MKVLADARQIGDHLDSKLPQVIGIADTRVHEQAGRVDSARTQHYVVLRAELTALPSDLAANTNAASALECQGLYERVR
jgi:hypothetical protein